MHLLLNNGLILNNTALGRSGLMNVLLNVMDDVVIHRAVENGLHFDHTVVPDCLLHDGSTARKKLDKLMYKKNGKKYDIKKKNRMGGNIRYMGGLEVLTARVVEGILLESTASVKGVLLQSTASVESVLLDSTVKRLNSGGLGRLGNDWLSCGGSIASVIVSKFV
jgi:hypothetical protein